MIKLFDNQSNDAIFTTECVVALIEESWKLYQGEIFLLVFVPFVVYAFTCLIYFSLFYDSKDWLGKPAITENVAMKTALKAWIYFFTVYMFSFEVLQMIDRGWEYFTGMFNLADLCSTGLILFLLLTEDSFDDDSVINDKTRMTLAGITILMTWYKVFNLMRLFNNYAFFINLLNKTFIDKMFTSFMAMLIILTLGVANMLYIFNKKRGDGYEEFEDWDDKDVVNK